ncbi:MAG TPA: GNAT family protein [Bryobacteraceae bacterium]|jgi:ribosomal-protein-serine acetyltransferase|nr:GNAT family protein [Bryobacteraceae bacterium]
MFRAEIRPGIELRLLEERHAPALFHRIQHDRDYLREWLPFIEATHGEDDTLAFIRASLEQFSSNEGFAAGIWGGELMGVIGTRKIDWMNRKVEVGYWIGREFQGRGIMTDACRLVIDHLFSDLDLHRVEIQCATGNQKSAAIPRRLGFTLEGTRRQAELVNGKFLDLLVFGMLRQDWRGVRLPWTP